MDECRLKLMKPVISLAPQSLPDSYLEKYLVTIDLRINSWYQFILDSGVQSLLLEEIYLFYKHLIPN